MFSSLTLWRVKASHVDILFSLLLTEQSKGFQNSAATPYQRSSYNRRDGVTLADDHISITSWLCLYFQVLATRQGWTILIH